LLEFNESIKYSNSIGIYYFNRAKCLQAVERYVEASSDIQSAYKLDPNNYEISTLANKLNQESLGKKKKTVIKKMDDY